MVAQDILGAKAEFHFDPHTAVFKVRGKMFMFITGNLVTVKCDPEISGELRQAFPTITPGYHMNKKHWITITDGPGVTEELLAGLIEDSYRLVVEKLPRYRRPPV